MRIKLEELRCQWWFYFNALMSFPNFLSVTIKLSKMESVSRLNHFALFFSSEKV